MTQRKQVLLCKLHNYEDIIYPAFGCKHSIDVRRYRTIYIEFSFNYKKRCTVLSISTFEIIAEQITHHRLILRLLQLRSVNDNRASVLKWDELYLAECSAFSCISGELSIMSRTLWWGTLWGCRQQQIEVQVLPAKEWTGLGSHSNLSTSFCIWRDGHSWSRSLRCEKPEYSHSRVTNSAKIWIFFWRLSICECVLTA